MCRGDPWLVSPAFLPAVLSIDRMEHPSPTRGTRRYPRYHSNLFRGQDAWDPHTHVLLPSQAPRPSSPEGESPGVTPGSGPVSLPIPHPDSDTMLSSYQLSQALIFRVPSPGRPTCPSWAPAPRTLSLPASAPSGKRFSCLMLGWVQSWVCGCSGPEITDSNSFPSSGSFVHKQQYGKLHHLEFGSPTGAAGPGA